MQHHKLYVTLLRTIGGLLCLVCMIFALDTIQLYAQTDTPTPAPTEIETVQPTPTSTVGATGVITIPIVTPNPTPTGTVTATVEPTPVTPETPTLTPTGSITPTALPTETPTETEVPSPTPSETTTPEPTATVTPTETPTATPTMTPTETEVPSPTPSETPTPEPTATMTPTETPTETEVPSPTPSVTMTSVPTITVTPTSTLTVTPTLTLTPTVTPTETVIPSPTPPVTVTPTSTTTVTPTLIPTATMTPTVQGPIPITSVNPVLGSRTISVIGRGSISAEPDIAQAQVSVESFQPNVQDASRQVDERMTAILDTLGNQEIDPADIQSTGHTITREGIATTGGYRVNKQLLVILRDVDQVATTLDAIVEAGANPLIDVTFTRDELGSWKAEAWTRALQDARTQAAQIAAALDVNLGPVLHVRELEGWRTQTDTLSPTTSSTRGSRPNGALQPTILVEVVFSVLE